MAKIAIIQLGRNGDVCSIIRAAWHLASGGNEIHWFVHPEFSGLLEAVSYVTVHPYDVSVHDLTGATEAAKAIGFDKIIIPQVDGNRERAPGATNFIAEQWARAGMLELFHDLPLIFDRRDEAGEAEAVAKHVPAPDGRPLLAFNFFGHSSPYSHVTAQTEWVQQTFGAEWRLLDFGFAKCEKMHHLLGLLQAADALITIDTLTLHLSYATMTPTVTFSMGHGSLPAQNDSEPQSNWIFRCSYPDSVTDDVRQKIERMIKSRDFAPGRLVRLPSEMRRARIRHAVNYYLGNQAHNPRILNAQKTWEHLRENDRDYSICFHELKPGDRTSRDIGDTRELPYIHDIIDFACLALADEDIVLFTNSDVCLVPEAAAEIRKKMRDAECCFSRRVECGDNSIVRDLAVMAQCRPHCGADLFAFKAGFWREHAHELPELFLACEGWDWVARHFCLRYDADAEMNPPIIYHQMHASFWAQQENIRSNPAQAHNRRECAAWATEHGLEVAMYGEGESWFLFRKDEEWAIPCPPASLASSATSFS